MRRSLLCTVVLVAGVSSPVAGEVYVVKPGDTLWSVAEHLQHQEPTSHCVKELRSLNPGLKDYDAQSYLNPDDVLIVVTIRDVERARARMAQLGITLPGESFATYSNQQFEWMRVKYAGDNWLRSDGERMDVKDLLRYSSEWIESLPLSHRVMTALTPPVLPPAPPVPRVIEISAPIEVPVPTKWSPFGRRGNKNKERQ